jgi:outer membrane protein assembly factor BamB
MTRSAALLALALSLLVPAQAGAQTWPTYQGNASHDGHVAISVDPTRFGLKWEIDAADGNPLNPVAAAEGKVFVTSTARFANGGLWVYDNADGSEIWNVRYGSVNSVNDPAYADGKVYLQVCNQTPGTYLRAYDATSGALRYRVDFSAQWEHYLAPTIVSGKVYIDGGYYGGIYRFDGTDGGQDWFQDLPQYDEWTPSVDGQLAYAYVGDYSPALYAFDRETGAPAWNIPDPNFDWNGWSMNEAVVLGSQKDAYAIHDGRLIKFDLLLHSIEWEEPRSFQGQPSYAGGLVYAVNAGALEAWDPVTHSLVWTWENPSSNLVSPMIVTDSHVFICDGSRTYAVNVATQISEWSWPAAGQLALSEGILYIASRTTGHLTAIQLATTTTTGCPPDAGPGVIDGVRVSRSGATDVAFRWTQDIRAAAGYHGYRFTNAPDTPDANVVGVRAFSPPDSATTMGTDVGAVVGSPSLDFYQIVGVCTGGDEGPIE